MPDGFHRLIQFHSYRAKLQTAFLLLGLVAVGVTGWEASEGAASGLRQATEDRLVAIRETRARQIERYFEDVGNHVLALSSDESTISALEQFDAGWHTVPLATPEQTQALRRQYDAVFAEVLEREPATADLLQAWFPKDGRTRNLQFAFIASNPYPTNSRFHLLSAPGTGAYSSVHARYHPTLQRYLSAFGFYDIFLLTAEQGRILYTVAKEVDLGTQLADAPYRDTALAAAWRRAMALPEPETFVVQDYAPYLPSYFAPAAFIAAPVYRAGQKIGALAIQVSIAEVNRVMTSDRKWAEEGLGRTGEAYVVGSDGTLRSDVRQEIEDPDEFYAQLQRTNVGPEIVNRIRRYRTAVLNLKLAPDDSARNPPVTATRDFRGVKVLRSQAPLDLPDLNWTVVAQIESEEAFAPVAALRWRILWPALLVAVLMVVAARVLASRVTKPLLTLAEGARMLGQRHFGVHLPVASEDEIGQLALSFNRMAEDLENTTVSRRELDRILNSLLNAVFVIDAASGATVRDVLDAPVRQANRAALDLLGYLSNDLEKVPFRSIVAGAEDEWEHRVRRILEEGRLPALEATLANKHGASVPVLLAASWLTDEPERQPGIVFIAQDIAEWKLTQDKLRRMSKVFMDATDPIVVTAPDGRISECNAEAERVYGWSRGELEGNQITILFPTRKRAELSDLLRRCLHGEPIRNVETVQVDRRGREIPALVTLSLLTGHGGEPAGVAAIAKDITDRKQAEKTLRQKQQELEALTARLLTAQEEERSRLARELHDDLTQRLAAVAIEVGRLERIPHDDTHLWAGRVEKIKQQMADLSKDVHDMSRRLHPSTLEDLGLVATIESECRAFFERGGPPVELSADETFDTLPRPVQSALYRIVQESLRNILKHSDADEVRIELRRTAEDAQLRIVDNGQGFDRTSANSRGGIGLASMEERARLIGGRFLIRSSAGAGTEVLVTVPSGMGNEEAESTAG